MSGGPAGGLGPAVCSVRPVRSGRSGRSGRGGFTLLETAVASVIGGLVLSAAMAVFLTLARAESVLSTRSSQVTEMSITQQVMRRSFMTLVLLPQDALVGEQDPALEPDEDSPNQSAEDDDDDEDQGGDQAEPDDDADDDDDGFVAAETIPKRPRVLLELDATPSLEAMRSLVQLDGLQLLDPTELGLRAPQRLELVLSQTPVPRSLSANEGWARRTTALEDELFAAQGESPPEESGVRGCYELRPDGIREMIIAGWTLSELSSMTFEERALARREAAGPREPEGWTLWWRPISEREYVLRQEGFRIDPDVEPEFLAGATPIARGLTTAYWEFVRAESGDDSADGEAIGTGSGPVPKAWIPEDSFWRTDQIMGYAEFTVETVGGYYADWMFEVGWSIDDEGFGVAEFNEGAGGGGNGGGGGSNGGQGGAQGGGQGGGQNGNGGTRGGGRGGDRQQQSAPGATRDGGSTNDRQFLTPSGGARGGRG